MIIRGRAVGDGPFLDVAIFPAIVEERLLAGDQRASDALDRFLEQAYDVEIDERLARAPKLAPMVKGGRS